MKNAERLNDLIENCKICGRETDNVFSILLEPVPICESCSCAIVLQHVRNLCERQQKEKRNETV